MLGRIPRSISNSPLFVFDRSCARSASCAAGVHQRWSSFGCATGHDPGRRSPRKPSFCSTSTPILHGLVRGSMCCRCSLPAAPTQHRCCTGARTSTTSAAARTPRSSAAAPPGCQSRPCFRRRSDGEGVWASALPH